MYIEKKINSCAKGCKTIVLLQLSFHLSMKEFKNTTLVVMKSKKHKERREKFSFIFSSFSQRTSFGIDASFQLGIDVYA